MSSARHPYTQFADRDLILRDYLATDRTVLANERTLLAYLRTALGGFVAGVSFIHFFDTIAIHVLGWVFCVVSIALVLVGAARFRKLKGSLQHLSVSEARDRDRTRGNNEDAADAALQRAPEET
jgi:putative membrane protein